jgi:chemotaxis protein methyltransferase CheR
VNTDIEDIETVLLLEAVYRRWGHDFRDYALTSMRRCIRRILINEKLPTISALQERVLRDEKLLTRFLDAASITVTAMFRDSDVYLAIRKIVVPILKERSTLRIWHAGCASGEEVYSLAILLHEEDLLSRTYFYATDINQTMLNIAKSGIYPLAKMNEYAVNYRESGGKSELSDYYHVHQKQAVMREDLLSKVVWAQHNLATDASFNEFDLILCRNVLIYFNRNLQERVHQLFYESLNKNGLLILGAHESVSMTLHEPNYHAVARHEKIYQRKG